jgi:hypothetical protein
MLGIFQQISPALLRHIVIEPFQQWVASQLKMTTMKKTLAQQEMAQDAAAASTKVSDQGKAAETQTVVSMEAVKSGAAA